MAILSCHVSIKLPPKISDGQRNAVPPLGNELGSRWGSEGASPRAGASPLVPPPSQSAAVGTHVDLDLLGIFGITSET